MGKTIGCCKALVLLWLCVTAGCEEKSKNLPVRNPVLPTSMMMPVMNTAGDTAMDDVVYVCKSPSAKRYHFKRECRGLKRCKCLIEESRKQVAENTGLTMCSFEN